MWLERYLSITLICILVHLLNYLKEFTKNNHHQYLKHTQLKLYIMNMLSIKHSQCLKLCTMYSLEMQSILCGYQYLKWHLNILEVYTFQNLLDQLSKYKFHLFLNFGRLIKINRMNTRISICKKYHQKCMCCPKPNIIVLFFQMLQYNL